MKNPKDLNEFTREIRAGNITPGRSGAYWSVDERRELIGAFMCGIGISAMSVYHERSEIEVVQQLITERLLTPPGTNLLKRPRKFEGLCSGCAFYQNQCCQAGYCIGYCMGEEVNA